MNSIPRTVLKKDSHTPPASERMAAALRDGRMDDFKSISPCAAALLSLLRALGWHKYTRELLESLPHFSDRFDLPELRNLLVSIGYETHPYEKPAAELNEQLFPLLYTGKQGQLLVLLEKTPDGIRYYDPERDEIRVDHLYGLKGTAYTLTDTHPTHGISTTDHFQEGWSTRLLKRFRGLLLHLIAMTFFINMVALAVPIFIMLVYDRVIGGKSPETLPYMIAGIAIALLADFGFRYLRARVLGNVAGRLDYLIGSETFRQLIHLPPIFTERPSVSSQLSRLRQFDSIRDFFSGPGASIALELPFTLLFIMVIILLAGPVGFIPIAAIGVYLLMATFAIPILDNLNLFSGKARMARQNMVLQGLQGRMEIKAIGGEDVWRERFRENSGEAAMAGYRTALANSIMSASGQLVMSLSAIAVVWWGAGAVMAGSLSVGALIATMALLWRVLAPIQNGYLAAARFHQVHKAMRQINQLMRIKVERSDGQSGFRGVELRGAVKLDHISFRYSKESDPSLLGVSIDIAPGELLAVAGGTGAGKSTLLKLIAGMYQPQAGSIQFDNMDIRQLNVAELRRIIAYVPQESHLFHGTIAQNMRLNNGLARREDLESAARDAGVLEDILALPQGFDTRVGDNTTGRLPPGFIQGIVLARALLRPAPLLLLDEPGASLDRSSDERLIQRLKMLRGRRTVIIVSHRPSHIRLADKVLLLEGGSVRYCGTPDEALELLMRHDR